MNEVFWVEQLQHHGQLPDLQSWRACSSETQAFNVFIIWWQRNKVEPELQSYVQNHTNICKDRKLGKIQPLLNNMSLFIYYFPEVLHPLSRSPSGSQGFGNLSQHSFCLSMQINSLKCKYLSLRMLWCMRQMRLFWKQLNLKADEHWKHVGELNKY